MTAVGSRWTIRDASAVDDGWEEITVVGHLMGEPVIRRVTGGECVAVDPASLAAAYDQRTTGGDEPDKLITEGGNALEAWVSE